MKLKINESPTTKENIANNKPVERQPHYKRNAYHNKIDSVHKSKKLNVTEGYYIDDPEYVDNGQLKVCEYCLGAIESHEGYHPTIELYVDAEDPTQSTCDWCEESGFDTLYQFI